MVELCFILMNDGTNVHLKYNWTRGKILIKILTQDVGFCNVRGVVTNVLTTYTQSEIEKRKSLLEIQKNIFINYLNEAILHNEETGSFIKINTVHINKCKHKKPMRLVARSVIIFHSFSISAASLHPEILKSFRSSWA